MRLFHGIIKSTDISLSKPQEIVNREAWQAVVHAVSKSDTT